VIEAYRNYDFHLIYQKVHNFCVVDMGGFYLDVIKDRLYTTPERGLPRRSAQTAMQHIIEAMVRWLAPILSFTAEEIWRHMPGERPESVFFTTWAELPAGGDAATSVEWAKVLEVRAAVLRELERLRVAGNIGAPLDAVVDLYAVPDVRAALTPLGDELRFVLITPRRTCILPRRGPPTRCAPIRRGDGAVDPRAAVRGREVRAVLAQARRRRQRYQPP